MCPHQMFQVVSDITKSATENNQLKLCGKEKKSVYHLLDSFNCNVADINSN